MLVVEKIKNRKKEHDQFSFCQYTLSCVGLFFTGTPNKSLLNIEIVILQQNIKLDTFYNDCSNFLGAQYIYLPTSIFGQIKLFECR